jgi:hypothetical protein
MCSYIPPVVASADGAHQFDNLPNAWWHFAHQAATQLRLWPKWGWQAMTRCLKRRNGDGDQGAGRCIFCRGWRGGAFRLLKF